MKTAYDYIREQFPNVKPTMSYDGKDFPAWQEYNELVKIVFERNY